MNYCKFCGHELNEDNNFCTECGKQQYEKEITDKQTTRQQIPASTVKMNTLNTRVEKTVQKPLSKKSKVLIGSIAGLLVILIGTHLWLSAYYDPLKDLQVMDRAISNDDMTSFIEHIEFDDDVLLDAKSYFQYIKNTEWSMVKSNFIEYLEQQEVDPNPFDTTLSSVHGDPLFTIQQNKVIFGLYKTYTFQALPTELFVQSPINETTIQVADVTEVVTNDDNPVLITSLYPGTYTMISNAKNIFGTFSSEEVLDILPTNKLEVVIDFPIETYPIITDYGDASLFINGKDSGKTLEQLELIGPISRDSKTEFHAEWEDPKGKMTRSNTVTVEDSKYAGLHFEFDAVSVSKDHSELELVGDHILNFRDAYEAAVNNKDFSLIASYLEKDSAAYQELDKYISDLKDTAYHYDFTDNQIVDVEEKSKNKLEVTTNELFTFTNHQGEKTDYDRTKIYKVSVKDEEFKITKIIYSETDREKQ